MKRTKTAQQVLALIQWHKRDRAGCPAVFTGRNVDAGDNPIGYGSTGAIVNVHPYEGGEMAAFLPHGEGRIYYLPLIWFYVPGL